MNTSVLPVMGMLTSGAGLVMLNGSCVSSGCASVSSGGMSVGGLFLMEGCTVGSLKVVVLVVGRS